MAAVRCSFFYNDTATTEIYTLSLHDALPISPAATLQGPAPSLRGVGEGWSSIHRVAGRLPGRRERSADDRAHPADRKSTRLNSSHANISYAVLCLKKKT